MSGNQSSNLLHIAVGIACFALIVALVGLVMPEAGDIAVDLGLGDLNDVTLTGESSNQTLIYNGTNWVNQDEPITASDGTFTPYRYDDINFPALSLGRGASGPTLGAFYGSDIQGLLFDGATLVQEVYGEGELSHNWVNGTDLIPHIHWMPSTTDAGNVTWFLDYVWLNVDGYFISVTTVNVTASSGGVAWQNIETNFPAINGTGFGFDSQLTFRLYRDPTVASDTYGADVGMLSFGLHYEMDKVGTLTIDG